MQESKETQRAGETLAVPSAHWVTFVQSLNFQVFKCLQLRQERAAKTKSPLWITCFHAIFWILGWFWAPRSKRSLPDMLSKNLNERGRAKNNSLRDTKMLQAKLPPNPRMFINWSWYCQVMKSETKGRKKQPKPGARDFCGPSFPHQIGELICLHSLQSLMAETGGNWWSSKHTPWSCAKHLKMFKVQQSSKYSKYSKSMRFGRHRSCHSTTPR